MRCKVCGAENREGIRFCTQCGNRVEKLVEAEVKVLLEKTEEKKNAIWHNEELVTDFVYDECGSSSCGLLDVCKDGKWGYIDDFGLFFRAGNQ